MPFISFTDEQIRLANSVDLPEFLINRGEKIKRIGKQYKFIYYDESGEHDSITLSGSVWFDHKNQIGGGPIRFMKIHYGMSFQDAMQALLGYAVFPEIHRKYADNIKKEEKQDFKLPEPNTNMQRVYAYLIKQRYIKPEIISFFAKQHTIYEEKKYHNVVFVGLDEKGIPRQAHKRSTSSYGKTFRITCEGSDTRYSFAHYGDSEKLYVFEAPIDLLSYLSLHTNDWQNNSYITMNGVYENSVLTALTQHDNIREIIICTDNDEGGIDAAERLSDILKERGYERILRCLPKNKDWNEDLKEMNGAEYLPAVPHRRKKIYANTIDSLKIYNCSPEKLSSRLYSTYINGQYKYLAEYALTGSVYFFFKKTSPENGFLRLKHTMKGNYRPYTDNEKYVGDCMLQKTYTVDCITHKAVKNNGEKPKYLLTDCHEAIIDRDTYNKTQQEIARRSAKSRKSDRTLTQLGKYSSMYALTEIMVCGECGTSYRRVTWTSGRKRVVWRCISRLDHGKKYCSHSPTYDESKLQAAILSALNDHYGDPESIRHILRSETEALLISVGTDKIKLIERRLMDIDRARSDLIDLITHGAACEDSLDTEFEKLFTEENELKEELEVLRATPSECKEKQAILETALEQIGNAPCELTEYDDIIVRKLINCVTAISKTEIRICFKDGYEMSVNIPDDKKNKI